MSYIVGQVVYALSNKETGVIPVQIIEILLRKNLTGEVTSYMVMLPDKKRTVVSLEKLNVEIFTTCKDLEDYMLENTKKGISRVIDSAKSLAGASFEIVSCEKENEAETLGETIEKELNSSDSKTVEVDLGDGVTGKINLENI